MARVAAVVTAKIHSFMFAWLKKLPIVGRFPQAFRCAKAVGRCVASPVSGWIKDVPAHKADAALFWMTMRGRLVYCTAGSRALEGFGMIQPENVGCRLRELRNRQGLSLRALGKKAGVAVSFLSKVEAGKGSPTLATLFKLLEALETSVPAFFAVSGAEVGGGVLVTRCAEMKALDDGDKFWRHLFPGVPGVKLVMSYEEYRPRTKHVEVEQHSADVCGVVLDGVLSLEVGGETPVEVHAGDSFYIRAGVAHVAANRGGKLLRMVVVELPHTRPRPLVRGRRG